MPVPTRLQIEANVALPHYSAEWKPGGSWVTITDYILNVSGGMSASVNTDNPLAFGDSSENECEVQVSLDLMSTSWDLIPIRIYLGFESNEMLYFTGVVKERSMDEYVITLRCTGFKELVNTARGYSKAVYRRPAATRTTVSSIEDPEDSSWRGGMINFILWSSGGRPSEQDFSYPSAAFYYSCQQAIFQTEWQWVAGENLWEEALKLARASGGQLYQDLDGIVKYKTPLAFAEGSQIYTYTTDSFTAISEDATTAQKVGEIRCNYTPRFVRPIQEVYKSEKPTLIEPGATHTFECETQWPLYMFHNDPPVVDVPGKVEQIHATFFNGSKAENNAVSGYQTAVTLESAQKIDLAVTNTHATWSMVVHRVTIYGEPIVAGDQGSASYGSGDPKKQLEDNIYVQGEDHARRLCMMVKDFYGAVRPIRHLKGCPFDTDRFVGEIVGLTFSSWSLSNVAHRIVAIHHNELGSVMDVDIVPIDGLPVNGTFFIVDETYADANVRQLSY